MKIEFRYCKKGDRDLAISGVLSKGWKQIFVFLWIVEIDISIIAKDWMIDEGVVNGYHTYGKNPKYANIHPDMFCFPKGDK